MGELDSISLTPSFLEMEEAWKKLFYSFKFKMPSSPSFANGCRSSERTALYLSGGHTAHKKERERKKKL